MSRNVIALAVAAGIILVILAVVAMNVLNTGGPYPAR